jgi:hypothetical protein
MRCCTLQLCDCSVTVWAGTLCVKQSVNKPSVVTCTCLTIDGWLMGVPCHFSFSCVKIAHRHINVLLLPDSTASVVTSSSQLV